MAETNHALEDIRLQIGDLFQLQASQDSAALRHQVALIGYLPGSCVLVTAPMQAGKLVLLRQDQPVVIRSFSGKSVYAFNSSVLRTSNTPLPHLYLSYPPFVHGMVVRRGMRAEVRIIASVSREGGESQGSSGALLVNISVSGALLQARARIVEKGQRLVAKFKVVLDGLELYITAPGLVRAVEEGGFDERGDIQVNIGVEWQALANNDQVMLSAFVYHKLLEQSVGL